jgi:HEAT repeat protein
VGKFLAYLLFLALLALGAAWYSQTQYGIALPFLTPETPAVTAEPKWLDTLSSQNPREAQAAVRHVRALGKRVIPTLQSTLRATGANLERRKAALRACVILEQKAAPVIPDVAAQLSDPELTEEAAMALSFMGRGAFGPLRQALTSDYPMLRREAVRSIGKLTARAPLDAGAVIPLLVGAMRDSDHSVRTVAATYIGILHEDAGLSVPALIAGLGDPDIEVRRASATALGSFGAAAEQAVPDLRKAAGDVDENLAREAGLALIQIQSRER